VGGTESHDLVEVRSRTGADHGAALESLTWKKKRRLLQGALTYMSGGADRPFRIDLVAVQVSEGDGRPVTVDHLKSVVGG